MSAEGVLRAGDITTIARERVTTRRLARDDREQSNGLTDTGMYVVVLAWIVFLGVTVRLPAVLSNNFPVNDGGMFLQAVAELKNAHFILPQYIHYNGLQIPYAYPPLGFYVAGLISTLTHQSILTMLRFIPITFSIATIVAFILFAQSVLKNRATVVASTLAFALVPSSHIWEIMGGGLTRSIGFFFAVLAIRQIYLLFTERSRNRLILTIVFSSLVCISHLEMVLFVTLSALVMLLFHGRTRENLRDAVLVAVGVAGMTSPWWIVVFQRFGLQPFLSAGNTGERVPSNYLGIFFTFNWGAERAFPIFGALAALGAVYCITRQQYFLLTWVGINLLVDPRKFETEAMIPLSMIVGICAVDLVLPLMTHSRDLLVEAFGSSSKTFTTPLVTPSKWIAPTIIGMIVLYGWCASMISTSVEDISLSPQERQAMEWVRTSTDFNSRFVVISGDAWARDRTSEWFPALASRISVATVQGTEWLPSNAFYRKQASYQALQKCSNEAPPCITTWATVGHITYDYIYLARRDRMDVSIGSQGRCCFALEYSLESDPAYTMVFHNDDATIFRTMSSIAQTGFKW